MKNIAPVFVFLLSAAVVSGIAIKLTEKPEDIISEQNRPQDDTQIVETKKTPQFRINSELPDIGKFTGTSERFYPDYTPDFIPSEEYGRIIPFTGSYKVYSSDFAENTKIGYSTYGFCTEDGKIVMDAADKNQNVFYYRSNDGFGFYNLSIVDNPQDQTPDDIFIPQKTVVIPESGAWSLNFENGAMINDVSNGIISIMVYEKTGAGECILYDYNGNELSRLGAYDNVVLSDCGLIGVMRWDSNNPFHGFIDKEGNVVLGSYTTINSFNSKGTTCVEDEEGWHIIDTTGKKLTPTAYRHISQPKADKTSDIPSVYVARRKDDSSINDIYSAEGEYMTTITGPTYMSTYFCKNGEILYSYVSKNTGVEVWKKLSDHSDFICKETGEYPNTFSGNPDIFIYKDSENKTGFVIDSEGNTILKIEDYNNLGDVSADGKYFVYSTGDYAEYLDQETGINHSLPNLTYYLYNRETETSSKLFSGEGYAKFCGKNDDVLIVSRSDVLTIFGDYTNYSLYDIKSGKFMVEGSDKITYSAIGEDDFYNVCTESICVLYDEEFKPLIKSYNE